MATAAAVNADAVGAQESALEEAVRELMQQAIETADALKFNKLHIPPGFAMDEARLRARCVEVKNAMRALRRVRHGLALAPVEAR
jgi:hypothetical protein